jgi:hypothetical protein
MKHELSVLDATGDSVIEWSADNLVEVEAAKAHFDALKKKGYLGFKEGVGGKPGAIIQAFDPALELITMTPPQKGG